MGVVVVVVMVDATFPPATSVSLELLFVTSCRTFGLNGLVDSDVPVTGCFSTNGGSSFIDAMRLIRLAWSVSFRLWCDWWWVRAGLVEADGDEVAVAGSSGWPSGRMPKKGLCSGIIWDSLSSRSLRVELGTCWRSTAGRASGRGSAILWRTTVSFDPSNSRFSASTPLGTAA